MAKQQKAGQQVKDTPRHDPPKPHDIPCVMVSETSQVFRLVKAIGGLLAGQGDDPDVGGEDLKQVGYLLKDLAIAGNRKWNEEWDRLKGKRR